MLASIVPLVERARNRRWGITVAAYVAGSLLAGGLLGALLGLLGGAPVDAWSLSSRFVLATVAASGALGAALDLGFGGLSLPTVRRQVNEDWLQRYRGWVYGLGFGFQLGLGVATIVTTATVYLVFVLAFLSGSWQAGAILGAAFGSARALPILAMARVNTPGRLRAAHRRMQGWAPMAARAAVGIECTVAFIGIAAAVKA